MQPAHWALIARLIADTYETFDAYVPFAQLHLSAQNLNNINSGVCWYMTVRAKYLPSPVTRRNVHLCACSIRFVILHGTDTMSFTASALSFMLDNLNKTIILTGRMIDHSRKKICCISLHDVGTHDLRL